MSNILFNFIITNLKYFDFIFFKSSPFKNFKNKKY